MRLWRSWAAPASRKSPRPLGFFTPARLRFPGRNPSSRSICGRASAGLARLLDLWPLRAIFDSHRSPRFACGVALGRLFWGTLFGAILKKEPRPLAEPKRTGPYSMLGAFFFLIVVFSQIGYCCKNLTISAGRIAFFLAICYYLNTAAINGIVR